MTIGSNVYDHPNYIQTRFLQLTGHGPTASVVSAAFTAPVNLKLYRVYATALIAGTTSTDTYTIRQNTTSIGLLTLADSAALFSVSADLAGVAITAGDEVNFLKGTDATGVAGFLVEFKIDPGQALSY